MEDKVTELQLLRAENERLKLLLDKYKSTTFSITETVIKVTQRVNDKHEIQSPVYLVTHDNEYIVETTSFVEALTCFINKIH